MTTRLTAGPPDAKINPEGFRTYRWPVTGPDGSVTERELLSVTSIRKLVGEPYGLVNWQIGKILDRALTVDLYHRLEELIAPVAEHDERSEGVRLAEHGDDLLRLRKWLREASTEERDKAASKGLDIHGALELGYGPEEANAETRPYIRQVHNFLETQNMEIVTLEFQCFNLSVGYAGTGDVLLRHKPSGRIVLGDWKTGKSVYVDHVVQLHAYLAGEFIGLKGIINEELTAILRAVDTAGILHVSPTGWEWNEISFSETVLRAFFGAVAFAQLLAANKTPQRLFSETRRGSAG